MLPVLSVVICTYNRSRLLIKTIDSLLHQTFDPSLFEIIIIDDGSTDDTRKHIENLQSKVKKPVITYFRKRKNIGLANSRNTIVEKLKSTYIAFIDDDAKADPDWLKEAMECFDRVRPAPQAVTGPVIPIYQTEKPSWFQDTYEADIKGDTPRFLKSGEAFSGPNMVFRKELIHLSGGFDESVDMKGDIISVGEETKLFERMWENTHSTPYLYYSPHAIVYHLIHPYKMTIRYRLKRLFASGQSYFTRNAPSSFSKKVHLVLRVFLYMIFSLLLCPIFLFRYTMIQQWIVERIGPLFFSAGFFYTCFGIPIVMKQRGRT